MSKGIKTIALSLFIICCIICAPAYGKIQKRTEKENPNYKPRNSRIWAYSDHTKAYEKENSKNGKNANIHEVSYKYNEESNEQHSDILFDSPFNRYRKYYDPDSQAGINYIKRPIRDFE